MSLTPKSLSLPSQFSSFRRGQDELILDLASHPTRFSLLCAPTGSGKSLINIAYFQLESQSNTEYRALYLTGTKGLQSQLLFDFEESGMVDIRGHKNYPCALPSSTRYDEDICQVPRDQCLHAQAISSALESKLVVSNYAKWVTLSKYTNPEAIGKFDLLICDEAHGVRDWLTSLLTLSFSNSEVSTLLSLTLPDPSDPISTWCKWGKSAVLKAEQAYKSEREYNQKTVTRHMKKIAALGRDLRELSELESHSTPWIVEGDGGGRYIEVKPVWPAEYAEKHLFRSIPRIILASADVSGADAGDLGIGNGEFEEAKSKYSFHPDRRPFYFLDQEPKIRVQKNMSSGERLLWIRRMDRFIKVFKDYKGIIQPRSYDWARFIASNSEFSDCMITHKPGGVESALEEFRDSTAPSILVSPAIEEGVDFPYDEAHWCIVAKVPFLYAQDPLTKARSESDKSYTNRCTARSLQQMVGRVMRAEDDWAVTIIMDDHWRWFRKESQLFAGWFRKSWKVTTKIPEVPRFAKKGREAGGLDTPNIT